MSKTNGSGDDNKNSNEELKNRVEKDGRRPLMQLRGTIKANSTFTDHQTIRDVVAHERGHELLEETKTLRV